MPTLETCPLPERHRCNNSDPDQCCVGGCDGGCLCVTCHPCRKAAAELEQRRTNAKTALQLMINQCTNEIRNIERFRDHRMLLATYDIKYQWERIEDAARELETAFEAVERQKIN